MHHRPGGGAIPEVVLKLLFAALLPLCLACPGRGDERCPLQPLPEPLSPVSIGPDGRLFAPGRVTVQVAPGALRLCPDGELKRPEAVEVRAADPQGRALPVEVSFQGENAEVTFEAAEPGWYHLEAEFLPSYGLSQLDVRVVRELETTELSLPIACATLDRLSGGAWLCDSSVVFEGEVTASIAASSGRARWVRGEVIWSIDQAVARRYRHLGGGQLSLEASGPVPLLPTGAVVTPEGALLIRAPFELWRLTPEGAEVAAEQLLQLTGGGALAAHDERLLVDDFGPEGPRLVTYQPTPDGLAPVGQPQRFNFFSVSDGEAVWAQDLVHAVRVFRPTEAGTFSHGMPIPADLFVAPLSGRRPVLVANGLGMAPLFEDGLLVGPPEALELVRLPERSRFSGADTDYAWGLSADGGTRVSLW